MESDYGADVRGQTRTRRIGLPHGTRDPLRDPKPLIRRVYGYVAYRIGEGPDAEDVTSTVFERAVRYRSSFDARKGDPTAWVLGIARHAIAEHLGKPVPVVMGDDAVYGSVEGPEDATVRRLTVEDALALLSDRDRDLFSLRFGAGLRVREIAGVLDIETHAAEVALARASARLRGLLVDAGM